MRGIAEMEPAGDIDDVDEREEVFIWAVIQIAVAFAEVDVNEGFVSDGWHYYGSGWGGEVSGTRPRGQRDTIRQLASRSFESVVSDVLLRCFL